MYKNLNCGFVFICMSHTWYTYTGKPGDFRKDRISKKMSWVPIPAMVVSVLRKPSTVEEIQDRSRFFGYDFFFGIEGSNTKYVSCLTSDRDILCTLASNNGKGT